MKTVQVKDVMVALEDYATVSENATLYEAVLALEKAQEEFDQSRYRHRAILVYDDKKKSSAKSASWICLWPLNPITKLWILIKLSHFGYSLDYLQSVAKTSFWEKPLKNICKKAANSMVKDFMHTPKEVNTSRRCEP
jgi:hypothetical protein